MKLIYFQSPRIEGLKMYIDAVKKDEIICDLDIK